MKKQLGGTVLGLMIGVVLGLAAALAVAVYVTKTPPTFANKGQSHTAESDASESKKNKDWENVCIIANSVVSNRQARLATKAYLKKHLALTLNEAETRTLPAVEVS